MESYHPIPRVQTSSLQCKNECGFYGNPSWDGYCSICYRATYIPQNLRRSATNSPSTASTASTNERKRPSMSEKGAYTLKNIFKFSRDSSRDKSNALPEECQIAVEELNAFLDNLRGSVGADVSRQISKLLEGLETMGGSHINQYSLAIQNFYQNASKRMSSSPLYSNLSSDEKDSLMNNIERFMTTWIYCWAFASPITDDEDVDIKLQEKIRSLHWVTPHMLDSPIDPNMTNEMTHLDTATFALIKVNAVINSEDKLTQVVQCSRSVFDALEVHHQNVSMKKNKIHTSQDGAASMNGITTATNTTKSGGGSANKDVNQTENARKKASTNADDFLPTLIWIILKSNPPLLYSNMQYIIRFANQSRLNTGEAGYFFTNFSCAVHFLRNLTHKSLNLTEEEFYRCMRTGLPLVKHSDSLCEGEKLFFENDSRLLDLEDKMASFEQTLESSESELKEFHTRCRKEFSEMRSDWPLSSKSNDLDPRQLDNPHILLLGPNTSSTDISNGATVTNHLTLSTNTQTVASLIDSELDQSINSVLPTPLQPSQFKPDGRGV